MARLFEHMCRNASPDYKEGCILVRLEEIPEIGWEYERFLSKNQASGIFKVGGYELGYASFSFLLFLVPLGILVLIYLQLRTTAKITIMLREKAVECSEVQQCLNSLFNERATKRLGEHRWLYGTVWTLVILVLVVTPLTSFASIHTTIVTNTKVEIDKLGTITPLRNVAFSDRTYQIPQDKNMLSFIMVLFLADVSLGLLVWRSVVKQLRPKMNRERR
ncbi:MAG: hypothetical protein GY845_11055 [Planctomycetes bacterium]|nr:hypothetical protein [Planctomycetota bacterium]